ncbi:MAG: macro domain-containing protein [Eubacteriales bacterium]|jgi:hypothetical protein
MIERIKEIAGFCSTILTFAFFILTEDNIVVLSNALHISMWIVKLLLIIVAFFISTIANLLFHIIRWRKTIRGYNYTIVVKKANIFHMKKCYKVIPFDECFTSKVGTDPGDINSNSICGQYIRKISHKYLDVSNYIRKIIDSLEPSKTPSEYKNKKRYPSGTIAVADDYLLLAFAKLNKNGNGVMKYDDYLECLDKMWEELDKYRNGKDICIPILGSSSATRFSDANLSTQDLLNIIICTYRLSKHKAQNTGKLYIVYKDANAISLDDVS